MCPTCKTYRGREVEPLRAPTAQLVQPIRVAVDVLGGDRAPEEIVAGAVEARSETVQPVLFGPAAIDPAGLELVETHAGDRDAREAGRGCSREAGELARRRLPVGARRYGRRRLSREHRRHACRLAARDPAAARCDAAGDRRCHPVRARPVGADRRGRERRVAAGAPAPVRDDGRDLRRGDPRDRRSPTSACSRSARRPRKATRRRRRRTGCSPRATCVSRATSRAAGCSRGLPTWSSPTASRATSR